MTVHELRAPAWQQRKYQQYGAWRGSSPLRHLQRRRRATPEAIALIAHRLGYARPDVLTYETYARAVERFAGALLALDVGPGQTVAIQAPNWWQSAALILACERVGAMVALIVPTFGPREVERILARMEVTVFVTPGRLGGADHVDRVAEMAARLPALRHHVVMGSEVPGGAVSFEDHFEGTPWETRHVVDLARSKDDPGRPSTVLFTSGTSGDPKGALHSHNTICAGAEAFVASEDLGAGLVSTSPHSLMHIAGFGFNVIAPLVAGGTGVLQDVWEPSDSVRHMSEDGVTLWLGAPGYLSGILAALEHVRVDLKTLEIVMTGAATVPPQLVGEVDRVLGLELRAVWGMTEVAGMFWTRRTDPTGWAAQSDGRPGYATEFVIRPIVGAAPGEPGRLFVRGSGVCLATISRDHGDVVVIGEQDDGWYDTGDLAREDGAGGIRIAGRVAALRAHPRITAVTASAQDGTALPPEGRLKVHLAAIDEECINSRFTEGI